MNQQHSDRDSIWLIGARKAAHAKAI